MPVTESRVKNGLLKLEDTTGTFVDFACQATSVRIVPDVATADQLETVGGCLSSGSGANTADLEISAISDFLDAAGLVAWSWKHAGQDKKFEWTPNGASPAEKWTGSLNVAPPIPVGGEANTRLTESITWAITQLTLPTAMGGTDFIGVKPAAVQSAPPVEDVPAEDVA